MHCWRHERNSWLHPPIGWQQTACRRGDSCTWWACSGRLQPLHRTSTLCGGLREGECLLAQCVYARVCVFPGVFCVHVVYCASCDGGRQALLLTLCATATVVQHHPCGVGSWQL